MYHVNAQGVDERMINVRYYLSVIILLLVLVGVSNLFFCYAQSTRTVISARNGGGKGGGGVCYSFLPCDHRHAYSMSVPMTLMARFVQRWSA